MDNLFTKITVTPLRDQSKTMKAHGTVLIAGAVEVRFTIMKGKNGLFANLPARKGTKPGDDGRIPWYPEVKIPDDNTYHAFQKLALEEFNSVMGGQAAAGETNQAKYEDSIPF